MLLEDVSVTVHPLTHAEFTWKDKQHEVVLLGESVVTDLPFALVDRRSAATMIGIALLVLTLAVAVLLLALGS